MSHMGYGLLKEIMELLIYFCVFYWVQDRGCAWGQSSRGGHTELPKGPTTKRGGHITGPRTRTKTRTDNRLQNQKRGMLEMMTLQQCTLMTVNKGSVRVKLKKNWKYLITPLNRHCLKVWHLICHHIHFILQDWTTWIMFINHHHLQTGVWILCLLLVF